MAVMHGILEVAGGALAHALKEIPGLVVLPGMGLAEPVILVEPVGTFRRARLAPALAFGIIAHLLARPRLVLGRLDADILEPRLVFEGLAHGGQSMGGRHLPGNEQDDEMSGMKTRIVEKLQRAFAPDKLTVTDDSASHAGHAGNPSGGGETHFIVEIEAEAFAAMSRLQRHRAVNQALAEELAGGVHALQVKARGPGEG